MTIANEEATLAETLTTPPSCSTGTNPGTQLYTAWARVGTNSTTGVWEYEIGDTLVRSQGQYGWAPANVPFDTGAVALDLQVDPTATGSKGTLTIGTGNPVSWDGNAFTRITAVVVRAEIMRTAANPTTTLRAEWQTLNIDFFSSSNTLYNYPGQATQACPMPFMAVTPPTPGAFNLVESRVILPGVVSGATYPTRMTLNGTIRMSSTDTSAVLTATQLGIRVLVFGT
jgi:hypothetical protein